MIAVVWEADSHDVIEGSRLRENNLEDFRSTSRSGA
jgi:hypothetical protein